MEINSLFQNLAKAPQALENQGNTPTTPISLTQMQNWAKAILKDAQGELLQLAQLILASKDSSPELQEAFQKIIEDQTKPKTKLEFWQAQGKIQIAPPQNPAETLKDLSELINSKNFTPRSTSFANLRPQLYQLWNENQLQISTTWKAEKAPLDTEFGVEQRRDMTLDNNFTPQKGQNVLPQKPGTESIPQVILQNLVKIAQAKGELYELENPEPPSPSQATAKPMWKNEAIVQVVLNELKQENSSTDQRSTHSTQPSPALILSKPAIPLSPTEQTPRTSANSSVQEINLFPFPAKDRENPTQVQEIKSLIPQIQQVLLTALPEQEALTAPHPPGFQKQAVPVSENLTEQNPQSPVPISDSGPKTQLFQLLRWQDQNFLIPLENGKDLKLSAPQIKAITEQNLLPSPELGQNLQELEKLGIEPSLLPQKVLRPLLQSLGELKDHSPELKEIHTEIVLSRPELPSREQIQLAQNLHLVEKGQENWKALCPIKSEEIEKKLLTLLPNKNEILSVQELKEILHKIPKEKMGELEKQSIELERSLSHLESREDKQNRQVFFVQNGEIHNAQISWKEEQSASKHKGQNKAGPSFSLQTIAPNLGPLNLYFKTQAEQATLIIRENQDQREYYYAEEKGLADALVEIGLELKSLQVISPPKKTIQKTSPKGLDVQA